MATGLRRTDEPSDVRGAAGEGVEEVRLSRDLTLMDITMLGVGALMGGGVFVLLGLGAGVAGPALLLAFFLNGLVTLPTLMVYAELGSAFHDAGGGYLWVKEALRQPWGFLGGWMGWFSHAVACAVYSLASGYYLVWLLKFLNFLPAEPANERVIIMAFGITFALLFVALNYVGVKQSVRAENAINYVVLTAVLVFLAFGVVGIWQHQQLVKENFLDFAPKGASGIFLAMGVTFISFEGYEIISQSSEEVKNPRRNVPRAIFLSLLIVWPVILLSTVVAIGLVPKVPSWQVLGDDGPLAMVEAAQYVMPYGSLIVLACAMLLQLVGLNATIYSSSRVSYAMGKDGNLPAFFGHIHPKLRTPHWSVLFSGGIIVGMALLPIEAVATSADVMFLLLFLLVDLAYLNLHRKLPPEAFGFRAPFFPWLPILGIIGQFFLAVYLFRFSPLAWLACLGWLGVGLAFYVLFVRPHEKREEVEKRQQEVLHEASRGLTKDYRILVPVANPANVPGLAACAKDLAKGLDGEIIFLHVVRVPEATPLGEGARYVADARPLFQVAERVVHGEVPMHSIVRIGHNVGEAIRSTAEEKGASLLLIGWRGDRTVTEMLLGATLGSVVENPPCDVAVLKLKGTPPPGKILLPTHGGGHAPLSVKLGGAIARARRATVTLYNMIPPEEEGTEAREARKARGRVLMQQGGASDVEHDILIEHGKDPVDAIAQKATGYDLVIIGASTEPAWRNYLFGAKPEQIATRVPGSVLMVKSHMGARIAFLRRAGRRLRRIRSMLRPD